jgi:hypothetical protein
MDRPDGVSLDMMFTLLPEARCLNLLYCNKKVSGLKWFYSKNLFEPFTSPLSLFQTTLSFPGAPPSLKRSLACITLSF